MRLNKLQQTAVTALEDIKARDVAAFDVTHLTSLFDRVIIVTADSARQTKALAVHVRERMKAAKNFITAIAKEIQRHADVEAVAEKSPVEDRPAVDAPPGAATGSILPPNPDKPAVVPATEPTPDQPPKPLR